jgi:hypothetical protein
MKLIDYSHYMYILYSGRSSSYITTAVHTFSYLQYILSILSIHTTYLYSGLLYCSFWYLFISYVFFFTWDYLYISIVLLNIYCTSGARNISIFTAPALTSADLCMWQINLDLSWYTYTHTLTNVSQMWTSHRENSFTGASHTDDCFKCICLVFNRDQ